MKVSVVRPHLGDNGRIIEAGSIMEVSERRAREMENNKTAVPILGRPLPEGAAKEGAERPTQRLQNGGPTGAEKPALLSPPVQAPRKPVLSLPKAKRV